MKHARTGFVLSMGGTPCCLFGREEDGLTVPSELRLPALATSPSLARRYVAEVLPQWGLDGFLDTALLVVSELVENAVLHTGGECELRLSREPAILTVTVTDCSPALPLLPSPPDVSRRSG